MKKIRRTLLVALVLIMLSSVCYGALPQDSARPFFLTVASYTQRFEIGADGSASGRLIVMPRNEDLMDEVVAVFEVENMATGERVYRGTKELIYSAIAADYSGTVTFEIEDRGSYSMEILFYCYSEGRLVETIRTNAMVRSY